MRHFLYFLPQPHEYKIINHQTMKKKNKWTLIESVIIAIMIIGAFVLANSNHYIGSGIWTVAFLIIIGSFIKWKNIFIE
jgi:fatty acid desaturase